MEYPQPIMYGTVIITKAMGLLILWVCEALLIGLVNWTDVGPPSASSSNWLVITVSSSLSGAFKTSKAIVDPDELVSSIMVR